MLNWRPVVDLEIRKIEFERREIEFERREIEFESRRIAHEKRMNALKNENALLNAINSRLARFERQHLSNSTPPPCTDDSWN